VNRARRVARFTPHALGRFGIAMLVGIATGGLLSLRYSFAIAFLGSPRIRHTVLLHAVLSFVYTTAILAFVLNLVAGMAG
jgi:hypothetical protein